MKCYAEFPCDNVSVISKKIYSFLETTTSIVANAQPGWQFVDCAGILDHVPELLIFFKNNKLLPRHAAITIVNDNNSLPVHTDELPVIAKLNFPVINTWGWSNCWYVNSQLVAEYPDMPQPIILNSQIAHSVERRQADERAPRIIASFTFHNEPLEWLR